MKWYEKLTDDEFEYLNEKCFDIIEMVWEDWGDDDMIVNIDELINVCNNYCDTWGSPKEFNLDYITNQHMLWFCITYIRHHDECYYIGFDNWEKAIDLEKKYENL